MIYIICALSAEARLFLDHYKLKQYTALPFKVYANGQVKLVVSGLGQHNALLATTALLAHFPPSKDSLLLNIGVAAAPSSYNLHSLVVVHKLSYKTKSLYPDILFQHSFEEAELTTVDKPQATPLNTLVDMEAFSIYLAASRFLESHQINIVKIISDHFAPEKVTKESILQAFEENKNEIVELIEKMQNMQCNNELFSKEEKSIIEAHRAIFTKSQMQQFLDALHYFKLKTKKELQLHIPELQDKKAKGAYLHELIKQLTH